MNLRARNTLVGRTAELSELDRLVAGLAEGRGGLGWIEGEPGAGKSALADALAKRAESSGCTVFRGAADEVMEAFPLRLMADCLDVSARSADRAKAEIAALLRGEAEVSGAVDPVLAAGERMLELVDRCCAAGPVALVVEDLHWADEPSLLIWARLARAVDQIPLLLIGTTRLVPHCETVVRLRALVEKSAGAVFELGPLGARDAARLAGRLAGGAPGPGLTAELARAGGNPLYVHELVDSLLRDRLVKVAGGVAELCGDPGSLPGSLAVAIGSRLGFLDEQARLGLRTAALLGNEFDVSQWAAATDKPVTELAGLVADAVAGGVLSAAGERLRFRHELIRQVLVEEVPPAARGAMHGQIAQALARTGDGLDAVARHLLAMPDEIDDWALTWLAGIGESALYAVPAVAARLLERAMESMGAEDRRWEVLATRLTQVLHWLGRDERCAVVAAEVVAHTGDPVLAVRMRIQIVRSLGRLGRPADALPFIIAASPGDDGLPATWRARLSSWSGLILEILGRRDEGRALAHDALRIATGAGDRLAIGHARHVMSLVDGGGSRAANMRAALDVLSDRSPESTDLYVLVQSNYMIEMLDRDRPDDAEAHLARLLVLTERVGTYRAAFGLMTAALLCFLYGRWDEALVHIAGVDPEERVSDLGTAHGVGALIALHREDHVAADAHLAAAGPAPGRPSRPLTNAFAMRAEADGDLGRAVALMAGWLDAAPGLRNMERHDDLLYLIRLALAAGDTATARAAAEAGLADAVGDHASPVRSTVARFGQALVSGDAEGLLSVAVEFDRHRWPLHAASALQDAAVRLAVDGETVRARTALTESVRRYTDLGATWDIRRADARLRPYGVRRGSRSAHRHAAIGWEALTPSEERIARLVAEGKSNPDIAAELFLSRRTVQAHVSNILGKLQFHSRIEVVRAASERSSSA